MGCKKWDAASQTIRSICNIYIKIIIKHSNIFYIYKYIEYVFQLLKGTGPDIFKMRVRKK